MAVTGARVAELLTSRQTVNQSAPCQGCGQPTGVRFLGKPWHGGCLMRAEPIPAPARVDDDQGEVANVTRAVRTKLGVELTEAQAADVLREWHSATGGLQFRSGWVGDIATGAYHWLRSRHGADARGVAGAEPLALDHPGMARFSGAMLLHLDWCDPDQPPQLDDWLTEYDINGQFLGASSIDLGTGQPRHLVRPRSYGPLLGMPGYILLGRRPDITPVTLPHTWRAFHGLTEGRALHTSTARHLAKRGIELDVAEALVWYDFRRHLDPWTTMFRKARQQLMVRPGPAAAIALKLLKVVTNTFLGGWMRSEKNHSALLRRDWSDGVIAEAWVRELIGLEKAGENGHRPCGVRRDAAWFCHAGPGLLVPQPVPDSEPGKVLQLGKWKPAPGRHVQVTQDIIDAHAAGPEQLVHAIITASKETPGGSA